MYCSTCGASLATDNAPCPACAARGAQAALAAAPGAAAGFSTRDKGVLILLASLLGSFGVDRFYRGEVGMGVLKLLTFGGCGVWAIIDLVLYCVSTPPLDAEGRTILDKRTAELLRGR